MRRAIHIFMLFQVAFLAGRSARADEYTACKARCAAEHAACLAEAPAAESRAKTAIEKTCAMELDACRADCEEQRSLPGLVRKLME